MTVHRWVVGVPLSPIEPQFAHALALPPGKVLPDLFYTTMCGREVLVRELGAEPGPDIEKCHECEQMVKDPAARARMLLALPPVAHPTPDPSEFVLVHLRLTPEMLADPFAVVPVHVVPIAALRGVDADTAEFTALCQEILTWGAAVVADGGRSTAPCDGCWWKWIFSEDGGPAEGASP